MNEHILQPAGVMTMMVKYCIGPISVVPFLTF